MRPRSATTVTVAAAALAFVVASVAHEAIGHGGACLATGGQVQRLTSVIFRCSTGGEFVALAGPLANLLVGLAAWQAGRHARTSNVRTFLALAVACNLFWFAGYAVFSAVAGEGDFALAIGDLSLRPEAAWRAGLLLGGVAVYAWAVRATNAALPRSASALAAYAAIAVTSCGAALFDRNTPSLAMREAALVGCGAMVGLLVVALLRCDAPLAEETVAPALGVAAWVAAAAVVVATFWATLGRGLGRLAQAAIPVGS